jgi:hypothetical protein
LVVKAPKSIVLCCPCTRAYWDHCGVEFGINPWQATFSGGSGHFEQYSADANSRYDSFTISSSNNTAPTPTVDTTPSPFPVDGATPTLDFDGILDGTTLHETGTQDPIEAFTTSTLVTDGSLPPSSIRTMGEQLLDSPPQTLPPIREDPAPSPAPPDTNRRAEQQREEKSQHYISEVKLTI